ncbi:MAG: inositol monophosphatase [Ilumatobacter sp.]|jgi:myo-inositol-1(or 4)-monophosphatase|nr:MAG: inositol monophosphatase [Ilumatobacter sp.]
MTTGANDAVSDQPFALLGLATDLARRAGTLALDGRRSVRDMATGPTKSSATDLVTEFDHAAERLVVDHLRRLRPDDAVVGEEGTSVEGVSGYAWYIDPIDGTTNFVYDLPSWCTSIAVTLDGVAVAGAVYVPVTDEMFAAAAGGGATLDGRIIRCSERDETRLALVATGFGYDARIRASQADRVSRLISSIRDIRRLGSAAIDLCHVAAGRVDAYYEEHLNAWDAAAGLLIATEAGAVGSDFSGGPARHEELLVAAPGVHAELLELLATTSC